MATGSEYLVENVGVLSPRSQPRESLSAGQVGFVIAGIKELKAAQVGDTITLASRPADKPLPGFKEVQPQVFAGLFPVEANQYDALRDSLEKLKLNDASLQYSRKFPRRSDSVSVVVSSGFCTWRSCRKGLNGNSGWI